MINRPIGLVLVAVAGAGVWFDQPLVTLVGLLGLLLAAIDQASFRSCLTGVEYERHLGASHVQCGEAVTLTVRVANRKLLPLSWLRTEERVPAGLRIDGARLVPGPSAHSVRLRSLLTMLPYEQVVRRYTAHCERRGLFVFGPGELMAGDLLGTRTRSQPAPGAARLIVYPKLLTLELPVPAARRIVGRTALERHIIPDPSRTVGVRPYARGDALRSIEWRSTARRSELQVRLFEPSADVALAVFVDLGLAGWTAMVPDDTEFAISLAGSLVGWALGRRIPAGIFGNAVAGRHGPGLRVPVSDAPDQLRRALEALALAVPSPQRSISRTLHEERSSLPFEASVALVTTHLDDDTAAAAAMISHRHPLTVLHVVWAGGRPVEVPGAYVLSVPYDPDWRERERVHLAA